jgi:sortase B
VTTYTPKHGKTDDEGGEERDYRPLDTGAGTHADSQQQGSFWQSRSRRSRIQHSHARQARMQQPRRRFGLALGIVLIVTALVIASFLLYKYINANRVNSAALATAGMDVGKLGDVVAPETDIDAITINWDALKAINPDIVGWVMIPGTVINYPIVQAADNDFYLTHLFDRSPSDAGAVFLDSESAPDITGNNNIVYGHNLLDGSMFASLKSYQDKEFFDAHRTILLATPEQRLRLRVDAVLVCDADDKIRRFEFASPEDYRSYVEMLLGYAVQSELGTGEVPEKLYCFVTCTATNYTKRTLVMASLVGPDDGGGE